MKIKINYLFIYLFIRVKFFNKDNLTKLKKIIHLKLSHICTDIPVNPLIGNIPKMQFRFTQTLEPRRGNYFADKTRTENYNETAFDNFLRQNI